MTHRLVTICSGTLLAARAGLLGSRRCTTHHELLHTLRGLAPQAQVVDNRVFVVDGPIASSAGITAGIDVALHLIAGECGEALAASVAEDMVVYLRRSDRDPEQSPFRIHRGHLHATVHRVQDAIVKEPGRDWTMAALAQGRAHDGAAPAAALHRAGRRVAAAVSPGDQARAGEAGARAWRQRDARGGGGRVPLRPADAAGVEPAVGRIAEGCVEGRARQRFVGPLAAGQAALAAGCAER